MTDKRESIAEKLRAVLAKLAEMETTYGWPISEWADLYREKLALERQLNADGEPARES
jgi:hypothetical protein